MSYSRSTRSKLDSSELDLTRARLEMLASQVELPQTQINSHHLDPYVGCMLFPVEVNPIRENYMLLHTK